MRRLSLGLSCAFALVALAVAAPAAPAATTPCWKAVLADWSKDNTVDGNYSASCIRQAMVLAPTDLKIYSSLDDDLQAALQKRSARRLAGVHVTPASLAATGQGSSGSFLFALLAGLAALVLACAGIAAVVRHRRGSHS
jgi:hypothetical protein